MLAADTNKRQPSQRTAILSEGGAGGLAGDLLDGHTEGATVEGD